MGRLFAVGQGLSLFTTEHLGRYPSGAAPYILMSIDISEINAILSMDFMQNAMLAALLASVACGLVGTLVLANRILFLAGGVAHAAYGGVGLAFFLALPVMPTTLAFSIAAALLMSCLALKAKLATETSIGVLWAAGMAVGIILIDLTPGYRADLMSYLFGSILAVGSSELGFMLLLDVFLLAVVFLGYQSLLAFSFDREFAASRGLPVNFMHHLLVVMAAVTVVMLIRVVGLLLVRALFSIPPAMAVRVAKTFWGTMVLAVLNSALFCFLGLLLACLFNLSTGAAIILVACLAFALFTLWQRLKSALPHRPN